MEEQNFEWDEDKRLIAIEKHKLDFIDAVEIFERKHLRIPARSEVEVRSIAIGQIHEITIAVVYTIRDDVIRIITARRARRNERELYEAYISERDPAP